MGPEIFWILGKCCSCNRRQDGVVPLYVWMIIAIFFTKVTCICVHDLLIACRSVVKIDNKLIIILRGKVLFNKFIGHLFPLMHVYRSIFSMSYKLICMLFWISMYVLIGSHKFFYFNWATGSQIGEDADLVFFFTLSKTFQRHSPLTFHLKSPQLIFKASSNKCSSFPLPPFFSKTSSVTCLQL